MKFRNSAVGGYVFTQLHFGVLSCEVPLQQLLSEGSVLTKFYEVKFTKFRFRNSDLEVMSWQGYASTNPLRRACLHEVPLPQLCSDGNVFTRFRFHNSAQMGMSS